MVNLQALVDLLKRREILLAFAGVLLLLVVGRAGLGFYRAQNQALDDEIALKTLQYEKFSRLIARQQEFAALDQALRKFDQEVKVAHLIQGETPTLTEVQFQNLLQTLARESAVDVRTTKVLPEVKKDGIKMLRLRLSCRAEIGAVKDFLLKINNNPKFIFLQEVEIKNISRREKRFYYLDAVVTALTV
ncbi:MAG: hypothetical protein JXR80_00885 [Deltaproteobacteria bacterium]|nr:hypothetical protein [Deltaproteobacteria bacterium]